jgi:hypothetical protein
MLFQQHLQVGHDAGALERRRVAPGRESSLRVGNRLLDGRLVSQQHTLFGFAGGRVENVLRAVASGYRLAANQVADEGRDDIETYAIEKWDEPTRPWR